MIEALLHITTAFGLATSAGLNAYIPLLAIALLTKSDDLGGPTLITLNPPYNYLENKTLVGVSTEIVVEMGRRANVPMTFAIAAVSLHGHRYFFPYGTATDSGAPFTDETIVEIGSCTKTFTTTLFALAINRNQMNADAPAQKYMPNGYTLRAQQLTPLELADFTSGMPDDPTNLPRVLERRSIESYTVKDFLTWASNFQPRTRLPAPYKYSNAGIGLLSYLVATATGNTWEDQINSEILQPLGITEKLLHDWLFARAGYVSPGALPLARQADRLDLPLFAPLQSVRVGLL